MIFPPAVSGEAPHKDMPDDIRADFEEARAILMQSPRGAAALLRLCIQKLCKHLGQPGENLNTDIGALWAQGLSMEIGQALDAVRVIGNNCVHPSQIQIDDNVATARTLLKLVNYIVEKMIGDPQEVKAIFDSLPETTKQQILERNQKAAMRKAEKDGR